MVSTTMAGTCRHEVSHITRLFRKMLDKIRGNRNLIPDAGEANDVDYSRIYKELKIKCPICKIKVLCATTYEESGQSDGIHM